MCHITSNSTAYPITVGGGEQVGSTMDHGVGSNSVFSTITSAGGGGGGSNHGGANGGFRWFGGGGLYGAGNPGGAGNTPPVSPPQGNPGW